MITKSRLNTSSIIKFITPTLQVNRRFKQGDVEGAQKASDLAQVHSHRAVILGIIVWGTVLIFMGSVALFGFLYGIGYYEYYS